MARTEDNLGLKSRYVLRSLGTAEQAEELVRLRKAVLERPLEFPKGSAFLSDEAKRLLTAYGAALREYPDLEVYVAGTVSSAESQSMKAEDIVALADQRSTDVARHLCEGGFLGETLVEVRGKVVKAALATLGAEKRPSPPLAERTEFSDFATGCVWVEPKVRGAKLLDPAPRLDLLLSRCAFGFERGSTALSRRGAQVVAAIAAIVEEEHRPLVIRAPKRGSRLQLDRAQAIAAGIREHTALEVEVALSPDCLECATVQFKDKVGSSSELLDPNEGLRKVLAATPLAFLPRSAEVVPEALPVLRTLARTLKACDQDRWTLLAEVYTCKENTDDVAKTMLLDRANRVLDHLRAEGVRMRAMVQDVPFDEDNTSIVLTCVRPGEEGLMPEERELRELFGCHGGGVHCGL